MSIQIPYTPSHPGRCSFERTFMYGEPIYILVGLNDCTDTEWMREKNDKLSFTSLSMTFWGGQDPCQSHWSTLGFDPVFWYNHPSRAGARALARAWCIGSISLNRNAQFLLWPIDIEWDGFQGHNMCASIPFDEWKRCFRSTRLVGSVTSSVKRWAHEKGSLRA